MIDATEKSTRVSAVFEHVRGRSPGDGCVISREANGSAGAGASTILSPAQATDQVLRREWRALVEASDNPNVMYQSPEWFDHLRVMNRDCDLGLAVTRGADGRLAGVVPLREGRDALDFHIAGNTLGKIPIRKVFLLGGRPMSPDDPVVFDELLEAARQAFPGSHGLGLPAVAAGDPFWRYLVESQFVRRNFFLYVVDGFREYHTLALPATFAEYMARFDAKKRYNLRRQVRLLREHGGGRLELRRFDRVGDVDDYVAVQGALARASTTATAEAAGQPSANQVRNLHSAAEHGLLRSYALHCGDEVVGIIRGNHYRGNYLVSRIEYRPDYAGFSPGVVMLHMAIEDLIAVGPTRLINFGFGEPNRKHHASNLVHQYGTVLLLNRMLTNRLRWLSHQSFRGSVAAAKRWFGRER